jgi:hypothetical protein
VDSGTPAMHSWPCLSIEEMALAVGQEMEAQLHLGPANSVKVLL